MQYQNSKVIVGKYCFYCYLVPAFTICNADDDIGVTLEELHAPGCHKVIIELAGADVSQATSTFEFFDTDGNEVVTREELSAGF